MISCRAAYYQRPSSAWCSGLNHTERRCRFVNLCYKRDTWDYIFLFDDKLSIISGVPSDRFSPALLDLSTVSDHNQFYFNYVEIPFGVLQNLSKIYKFETIKGRTLIFSRFKPDNLMHLFHDDIIPLYFTLHEIGWKAINGIFFDDIWPQVLETSFQFNQHIYGSIFPKVYSRDKMEDNTIYCFEEAFVGLSKSTTWYQYGFRVPQSPISRSIDESKLISNTIRRLANDLMTVKKCSTSYVILVSRKLTRKILNEDELQDLIWQMTKLPIIKLELTEDLEEILKKVMCAKVMIGMHGSGLILSMFLRPGSSLVELFPFAVNADHYTPYKTLTQLTGMDINYFSWKNQMINNTVTHSEYAEQFGGIEHLSDEEKQIISSNSEDVPKHLCCFNPYWLYRIYQDTIVDIHSLKPILQIAFDVSPQYSIPSAKQLSSSRVLQFNCSRVLKDNMIHIHISWEQPWNVKYLKELNTKIKYEILIQEVPSNSAKSITRGQNEYVFVGDPEKTYNIWIRCKLNEINGPFNTNPLIC